MRAANPREIRTVSVSSSAGFRPPPRTRWRDRERVVDQRGIPPRLAVVIAARTHETLGHSRLLLWAHTTTQSQPDLEATWFIPNAFREPQWTRQLIKGAGIMRKRQRLRRWLCVFAKLPHPFLYLSDVAEYTEVKYSAVHDF